MRRPSLLPLVLLPLLLVGCGATYRVTRTGPDGVTLEAVARTAEKSTSIEFTFQGDLQTGKVTGLTFRKVGAEPVNLTADTLRALLGLVPAAAPVPK